MMTSNQNESIVNANEKPVPTNVATNIPVIASKEEAASASNVIYVRHCDPNSTGEGLGSHARGTLYPLLQIALHFNWKILWEYDKQPCWKTNEYRKYYRQECLEMGQWLGFGNTKVSDLDRNRTLHVPLQVDHGDARFGDMKGSADIVIYCLEEYISQHGVDKLLCRHDGNRHKAVLITLYGRFEYQNDPTPPVLHWMHQRCETWKSELRLDENIDLQLNDSSCTNWNIVLHIRVPEDYCTQKWKDANSMSHALETLEKVWYHWKTIRESKFSDDDKVKKANIQLDVFTEESFSNIQEDELKLRIQALGMTLNTPTDIIKTQLQIHRQTPLLPCVQAMAVSDIFIPASSYLSSMAAFFHTSLIVLPNESTRQDQYFVSHLKHAPLTTKPSADDSDNGEGNSTTKCPIERVEDDERLNMALHRLWQTKPSHGEKVE